MNLGTSAITEYLRVVRGIHIDSSAVHRVVLEEGLTKKDPKKSFRRRPWVRYEKEHSLSAVHMDWYLRETTVFSSKHKDPKIWVCAVLDDASRMILAGGEFDAATAEHSISLLREAHEKYLHISPIREVITDHGSQPLASHLDWLAASV